VPQRGALLRQVEFDLDVDADFRVDLRVQNVSPRSASAPGMRIGCEFVNARKRRTLCVATLRARRGETKKGPRVRSRRGSP
jgi:hypothetical protein